jgi:spermidine synthase
LYTGRGYFGVHRVLANRDPEGLVYHHLVHGSTIHGRQARSDSRRCEPLTYYHRSGPLGDVFAALPEKPNRRVAIVGLGTGAMVCYARPGDVFTFYEIDPLVREIAQTPEYFSFLSDCRQGQYEIVLGDGRLQLAAADQRYGVMIFDAFSSDAVPVHLLTREAITLYERRLDPSGLLVFHASNTHLDLARVLAALAADLKLACVVRADVQLTPEEFRTGKASSTYVVLARSRANLGALATHPRWHSPRVPPGTPVWTDDSSNILGALLSEQK